MPETAPVASPDERFRAHLEQVAGPDHWVHVVDCAVPESGDPWEAWVGEPSVALLRRLDAAVRAGRLPRVLTSVVRLPGGDTSGWDAAVANAAVEAARGVMGVAALELGPSGLRANTVVVGPATSADDVSSTVAHLGSASFTTGATYRLAAGRAPAPGMARAPRPGRVLVTGAAGGLGAQAARALAEAGWTVIPSDLPGDGLADVARELGVSPLPLDVTDAAQVRALRRAPQLGGVLQGVAILHGIGTSAALGELDECSVGRALAVNGTGVHDVLRAVDPLLERGAPSTAVVLSSQAGVQAEAYNATYCAAKFAVLGLVHGLAPTLGRRDVRIHALCPGPVDTPLMRRAFAGLAEGEGITPEAYTARRIGAIPARRVGTAEDIADAVVHLFGLAATGVTAAPTGGEVLT